METPAGTDYDPQAPRTTSRAEKKGEGFLAVSQRFAAVSGAGSPGPGSYDVFALSAGVSAPFGMRTDSALGPAGPAGSPGPGSYEPPDQWHAKTFNVLYGEVE